MRTNYKKIIFVFLFVFSLLVFVSSDSFASYWNYLTIGQGDNRYCLQSDGCGTAGSGGNLTGNGNAGDLALWDNSTHLTTIDYSSWDTDATDDVSHPGVNDSIDDKISDYNDTIQDDLLPDCVDGKIAKKVAGTWQCTNDNIGITDTSGLLNYTKVVEDNKITMVMRVPAP